MKLKVDLSKSGIPPEFMDISGKRAKGIVNELFSGKGDMTGWVNWPNKITETYINDINDKAAQIRNKCDLFVVIGIGGSYAGAKAVLDAKGGSRKGFPEICFTIPVTCRCSITVSRYSFWRRLPDAWAFPFCSTSTDPAVCSATWAA